MFALLSLLTRTLADALWPTSVGMAALQALGFILFYEVYSFVVHRLLHTPLFRRIHRVHHRSVVTTPWSAYSVHPVEAALIGLSAPLYMLALPLSLGVAFVLHFAGILLTIGLHANITHRRQHTWGLPAIARHGAHHTRGNVNYGFTQPLLDKALKTHATGTE
ncbi:sterol desaturase family protein [Simiduia sp. 21SJ11W-1]|uniref:sterol desaturase family protein n=1 Tax=Simiduia sp. 21SJ11W-1 TaxID=2909669 RepID=UPI00209E4F21|nr:sterol desaturase family protein [Simiduia sp. 21SJ11W-1]UTA46704.1 sterol desaturase family protein [Simiduia sp. 21SJ11W-1]